MISRVLVNISWLRFVICIADPSWRIVSIQKSVALVALVVVVGLMATVEVAFLSKHWKL
jgi:hypothetical protein